MKSISKQHFNWTILVCLMFFGTWIVLNSSSNFHMPEQSRFEKLHLHYENTSKIQPTSEDSVSSVDTSEDGNELASETDLMDIRDETTETPLDVRLQRIVQCKDRVLEPEMVQYGSYWLLKNIVRGAFSQTMGCAESITYTTNGDYTFFDNLAPVVVRWHAPISFAVFSPGYDFNTTMESIQYVRNCLPESGLISSYVTFHVYFPSAHMPAHVPRSEDQALDWPYNCEVVTPPYMQKTRNSMYKTRHNLTYPINVGRNIARKAANTHFIFACDIELFPTPGFVNQFLEMVARNASLVSDKQKLHVFPLPVFELHSRVQLPENKTQLKTLLKSNRAIPFHARVCRMCHLVPNQSEWINSQDATELSVFSVGKREGLFRSWEPFYVSDNREPMFDERVSWEGQSNKRIQGYAMCLLQYEYHVLHPAFLVHAPGIKKYDPHAPRLKYVPGTNRLIRYKIVPEYQILYGKNSHCDI